MKSPLRILHLEDDPADAKLVQSTLEAEGIPCETTCVRDRDDFVGALERGGFDLILSDFCLPTFDGLSALEIVRARWPAIPIILVSGTLGEQQAIDSLTNGACDYVLKDHLSRLAPAVRRSMEQAEERATNRRTEEALQETQQRLRIIFNQSPLGIALVGEDGHPVLTNAALNKMLGYTGEEFSNMHFKDFTHPDDCAKDLALFQELIQGGRESYQMDKRYIRKDGQVVWARISVSLAQERAGHAHFAVGMVEDITEKRDLQAQFIEAQKMEVIGHLASGVAHDFNNILAIVMGYSDLMIMKLAPKDELKDYVETIRAAAERAASLTRQLLIFSRKQTVQLVVLDVNEVVKDLDQMLRRLIDENIKLAVLPGTEIGRIKADSGYVGQVVMNLVVNARDAMPNGGQLTIATSNVTLNDLYAHTHPGVILGGYVMLSVTDTGTGMTEEVKARIFEAFFTTKPKGKGTGLGLATCQTIVQQSCGYIEGGYIEVQSELGKGTTFKVYFPRVDQPLTAHIHNETAPTPHGTETLLVVEDEPSLRHLARSVLQLQGYQVLTAANGQDALHVARDHTGSPIRLVITDVIMPVMGGVVMAEWLKSDNPEMKILFTSGYTDDAITQHGALENGVEFLSKPYTAATLARKVRELLDK
jgi:two-component system, cell cycle sensor histidine kinase and response regulator CckA